MSNPLDELFAEDEPNLTADEWILWQTIDPKKKLQQDVRREVRDTMEAENYAQDLEEGVETIEGLPEGTVRGKTHVVEGGFAFGPLIAGIVAPLLTNLIGSIFKPRQQGSGVSPPQRFGRGIDGGVIAQYVTQNRDHFDDIDSKLAQLHGNKFWRTLVKSLKNELMRVLPEISDVRPNMANIYASRIIKRVIPMSFQRSLVKDPSDAAPTVGSGRHERGVGATLKSISRPVLKWIVNRIVKGADKTQIKQLIDEALNNPDLIDKPLIKGAGPKWEKFKVFLKKVADFVLPSLAPAAKDLFGKGLDVLLSKLIPSGSGCDITAPPMTRQYPRDAAFGRGILEDLLNADEAASSSSSEPSTPRGRALKMRGRGPVNPTNLVKGSPEAKAYMAKLRAMRGKKKQTTTRSRTRKEAPAPTGRGRAMKRTVGKSDFTVRVV